MDSIPVFFCTDNAYTVPTYIAIYSLLKNRREKYTLEVFIMTSGDFSDSNTLLLHSLTSKFPSVNIHLIDMGKSYESVTINNPRISKATLYRLMIPRILRQQFPDMKIDRCIYLDSDLVVEGDIIDLYRTDVGDCYVCGVLDRGAASKLSRNKPSMIELRESMDIPTLESYINAGVLLLNLKSINANGKDKELEECGYRSDFRFNDQDVINKVLFGGIKTLPPRYNVMAYLLYPEGPDLIDLYGKENLKQAKKRPLIVHYISKEKPWSLSTTYLADKWWKYVRMQNKEIRRKYILPFVQKQKLPKKVLLFETIRTIAKKTGTYSFARKIYLR